MPVRKSKQVSTQLPASGFVRLSQVLAVLPIGKSSWWLGVKEGRYPKPVKLSERTTAWCVEDIRHLIERVSNAKTETQTMPVTLEDFTDVTNCSECGFISCICPIKKNHKTGCRFRRAAICAVPIECDHGRDVCPICDPCTCDAPAILEITLAGRS